MTFDDFKKQFERFSKIDTAEKLAICESQYRSYLLSVEDEKYFEPQENRFDDDIVGEYEKNLTKILHFDVIAENQIYFLAQPSFDPESLLRIERFENRFLLTLTSLIKSYWTIFYNDNNIKDIEKKVVTAQLNITTGNKLFNYLEMTILQARKPKAGRAVLDGVVYRISKLVNGEQMTVVKHSPTEASKSGQVIEIMQLLIDHIEDLNDSIFLDIERKIEIAYN